MLSDLTVKTAHAIQENANPTPLTQKNLFPQKHAHHLPQALLHSKFLLTILKL